MTAGALSPSLSIRPSSTVGDATPVGPALSARVLTRARRAAKRTAPWPDRSGGALRQCVQPLEGGAGVAVVQGPACGAHLQAFAESCDGSNYPEAARMRKQVEVFMARRDTLKASS